MISLVFLLVTDAVTVDTIQLILLTYLVAINCVLLFLFQCHIQLDRKVLTDLAIYEPRTFKVR